VPQCGLKIQAKATDQLNVSATPSAQILTRLLRMFEIVRVENARLFATLSDAGIVAAAIKTKASDPIAKRSGLQAQP
jgi:hypothetical protein